MLAFFNGVIEEAKKLHFPSKKETYITVITILVFVTISTLVVMFADFLISVVIKILFSL